MKKILILGAGISGLATAWHLKKRAGKQLQITILEKESRPGGCIQTICKDGFLFELGPHSFRGENEATLQLVKELDLEHELLRASPAARRRFLYRDSRLQGLPHNLLTACTNATLLKALIWDLFAKKGPEDETIEQFSQRRYGKTFTEEMIDPLTTGIYAGDISQLSIRSCFPSLYRLEKSGSSLLKNAFKSKPTGIFTFKNGMQTLVDQLHACLDVQFQFSQTVTEIGNGMVTTQSDQFHADYVVSALPAPAAAKLLGYPYNAASVAVVSLGYNKKVLKQEGFGYLIPSKEKENILGVIWDSSVFPDQNSYPEQTRLTVMLGGAHMKNFSNFNKHQFFQMAIEALQRQMGINELPDASHIWIGDKAIPQYHVGHHDQIACIEKELQTKKMAIAGSSLYGVAINDTILHSRSVAEMVLKELECPTE